MKFFYSSGVRGYGIKNRLIHNFFNFPEYPAVTKTLTFNKKIGYPFAIMRFGKTIWNKISLHNCGFVEWLDKYYNYESFKNVIVSIAGTDTEICTMVHILEDLKIKGIELNFSCPNVKSYNNKIVPHTTHDLYLKLNHKQDPYNYDLSNIKSIRVNSIPTKFGGLSGKYAQKKNWKFIEKFNKEGLNISGASCLDFDDFQKMEDIGCHDIGLGTITLINPKIIPLTQRI
jgi:dihydroorotate dehydrogenase